MPETLSTFPKCCKRPVLSYMPQYSVEIYFNSNFLNLIFLPYQVQCFIWSIWTCKVISAVNFMQGMSITCLLAFLRKVWIPSLKLFLQIILGIYTRDCGDTTTFWNCYIIYWLSSWCGTGWPSLCRNLKDAYIQKRHIFQNYWRISLL